MLYLLINTNLVDRRTQKSSIALFFFFKLRNFENNGERMKADNASFRIITLRYVRTIVSYDACFRLIRCVASCANRTRTSKFLKRAEKSDTVETSYIPLTVSTDGMKKDKNKAKRGIYVREDRHRVILSR